MKNFGRALADAFRFWPILLVATLCAVGNGAIWGLNIGALYPVIEVTIAGDSLQNWIANEITEGEQRVAAVDEEIAGIRNGVVVVPDPEVQLELLQTKRNAEQAGVDSSKKFKPYIDRYLPNDPFETVLYVMACVMLCTALKHVFQFGNTALVALIAARITRRIQTGIFSKAMKLDQASFAGYTSSGFVGHITYTTNMLSNGIVSVFGGAVCEPLKLLSCLIGAAIICPRLLLVTLLVVPVVALLLYLVSRSLKKVCRSLLEQAMGLHHVMLESLNNIRTVQAYCQEPHEQSRFDKATLDMQRFTLKIVSFNALNRPLTELLALGMMTTAVIAGSYLVMNRATHLFGIEITSQPLGATSMLVFFGMLVGASDPVRKMARVIEGINTGAVAANMLYPMLDQASRIVDKKSPVTTARPHRQLQFENIHFEYEAGNPILKGVDLVIPHGSTVAVVGANGSGKSSMINLLCRFYDPISGRVCLDGTDIREMKLKDLRGRIALVTQNTELFNEDLYYNIGYGAEEATVEQIHQAAVAAHADSFIRNELPEQFDTVIGQNGQRLSGGQRQRIALARALIRNPDILILDEATSQIDMESERLIFDSIREHCHDRTVLFVTHRQEVLEFADIILRVSDGDISVERNETDSKIKRGGGAMEAA